MHTNQPSLLLLLFLLLFSPKSLMSSNHSPNSLLPHCDFPSLPVLACFPDVIPFFWKQKCSVKRNMESSPLLPSGTPSPCNPSPQLCVYTTPLLASPLCRGGMERPYLCLPVSFSSILSSSLPPREGDGRMYRRREGLCLIFCLSARQPDSSLQGLLSSTDILLYEYLCNSTMGIYWQILV